MKFQGWHRGMACRDEECAQCGYPFDGGEPCYLRYADDRGPEDAEQVACGVGCVQSLERERAALRVAS